MIISDALEVGGWRMARRIQKPEKVDFKYPFKGPDNSKLFADVRRLEEGSKEEPVDFSCSCPHRPPSSSLGEIEKRDCRLAQVRIVWPESVNGLIVKLRMAPYTLPKDTSSASSQPCI